MRFRVSNARHAAAPIRRRIRLGRSASRIVEYGETALPSFSHALALRYEQAASLAGADTELLSLDSLQFDLVLRRGSGEQALEPNLQSAQAAIERAGHVAWFFPTWWAGPPALVKGFVDRTFLPGFAYRYESGRALQHKLLRGRSARLVTSMDAPWWWYACSIAARCTARSFMRRSASWALCPCTRRPPTVSAMHRLRSASECCAR